VNAMNKVIEFPNRTNKEPTREIGGQTTYTVDQAAALLGISRSHAYACVKSGDLPALRFKRRLVIPARAIEALLATGT
jgi:excisionase family DNA binding protein